MRGSGVFIWRRQDETRQHGMMCHAHTINSHSVGRCSVYMRQRVLGFTLAGDTKVRVFAHTAVQVGVDGTKDGGVNGSEWHQIAW